MFKVEDKTGQEIFLKDKVNYEVADDMGSLHSKTGFVLYIPAENMVQIQPIDEGSPDIVEASSTVVVESLIQDITKLSSSDEFQAYIAKIEERYESVVKAPRKSARSTAKAAKPAVAAAVDLGGLL